MQFQQRVKKTFAILFLSTVTLAASAQDKPEESNEDSLPKKPAASASTIKPYKDVITSKAVTSNGFIKVHKIDDKYFFEIPNTILGRQMLSIGRIAKSPADPNMLRSRDAFGTHKTGYAGDKIAQSVIEFGKGPKNKIFLKLNFYFERALDSSDNGLYRALQNNNVAPIVAAFDIKAIKPDSSAVVIDMTDFINGDNSIFYFVSYFKKTLGLTAIQPDRSYTEEVKAYPTNVEIKTVKTYKTTESVATFGLSTSLILLPKENMRPRYNDIRLSYDVNTFTDFDINPQGVDDSKIINKWRLDLKESDLAKYKKGELVEPQKPIVFYIDPATPKKWVPWIKKGVEAWQVAFEAAGFKNAILAKEVTAADKDYSISNSQYSTIVYTPTAVTDEDNEDYNTVNPFTGEIIESHIIWDHSAMEQLQKRYLIQCGLVDKAARTVNFSDDLMGRLIQERISHKVGHGLGLLHNRGASATVPVANLRNKNWVDINGIAPSIMDVVEYNYVAQPGGDVSREGLLAHVGVYDKFAIAYGYKLLPEAKTAEAEKPILSKWVTTSITKDPSLNRGSILAYDPRAVNNTLGDNILVANAYGIKNLKATAPQLITWAKEPNKGYLMLNVLNNEMIKQYRKYVTSVTTFLGGIMSNPITSDQPGVSLNFVNKKEQKDMVNFLNEYFFTTPTWLFNDNYYTLTGQRFGMDDYAKLQSEVLDYLVDNNRLINLESDNTAKDPYTATEFFGDLKKTMFSDLTTFKPIDQQKRMLQKQYIALLGSKIIPGSFKKIGELRFSTVITEFSDAALAIKSHLKDLQKAIQTALPNVKDAQTKYHLIDLSDNIKVILKGADTE